MQRVNQHNTVAFVYSSASGQLDGLTNFSASPLGRSGGRHVQTFNATIAGDMGVWSPHEAMEQAGLINAGNTLGGVPEEGYRYQGQRVHSYLLHNIQLFQDEPGNGPAIRLEFDNQPGFDQAGAQLDVLSLRDDLVLGTRGTDLFFSGCRILTPNKRLNFLGDGIAGALLVAIEVIPITDPGTFTDICIAMASGGIN